MALNGKKVLVTGSNGFVGKHLCNKLRDVGALVTTFDLSDGDITNWNDVKKIPSVDIIFHLAAVTYVPFAFENPRLTYLVNVTGTLNVVEFCRINDIDKMVFTSSYIYGKPEYLPVNESHPIVPTNPYAKSKFFAEQLCTAYNKDFGLNCVTLRPFNIFGEGQSPLFLIPSMVKQLREGDKIVLNDAEPKRDFLYIDDLVEAYLKAAEYPNYDVFNIGMGKSYSVREIIDMLLEKFPKKVKVIYRGERRKNDVMDVIADVRKAKKKLKWGPKIKIVDGLRKILE
jgi:UDP-glucose 4-epimerase